jgi:hypothetical protein
MALIHRKERGTPTSDGREKTIRLRNIGADTNPRDLIDLFGDFDVVDASVQVIVPEKSCLTEAFVTLPEGEIAEARGWASGLSWRGKELKVTVQGEDGW